MGYETFRLRDASEMDVPRKVVQIFAPEKLPGTSRLVEADVKVQFGYDAQH
jgi:hypothetical protein